MTISDSLFETTVERIELEGMTPEDAFVQAIHDCPECQAARERGEVPEIIDVAALRADRSVLRRRPRWRHLKRHIRR